MRIVWLRAALKNLNDEAGFIAADQPQAARAVIEQITRTVALLATQPALGRPGRVVGTRELIIPQTHYLVPYLVRDDAVVVLRVFHASRRTPRHW